MLDNQTVGYFVDVDARKQETFAGRLDSKSFPLVRAFHNKF